MYTVHPCYWLYLVNAFMALKPVVGICDVGMFIIYVQVIPSFFKLYFLQICCSKNRTESCPIRNSDIENKQEWLSAPIVESKSTQTSITLTSTACNDHIVAVRYAWREAPCSVKNCAIYSADANFPMPPYIRFNLTDDGVTRLLGTDQVRIL